MDYKKLGIRIKNRRLELNMTQEKLSELSSISSAFLGQVERAERKLSLETLVSVANSLNTSVDYLLNDSIKTDTDIYLNEINNLLLDKSDHAKATAVDILNALLLHIQ